MITQNIQRVTAAPELCTTPFGVFGTSVAVSVTQVPASICSMYASNANAALRYLQVFNQTTAPTTGNVPIHSFPIPINGGSICIGTDFFGVNGGFATQGVAVGVSTTNATFTAATTTDHNINGMYKVA